MIEDCKMRVLITLTYEAIVNMLNLPSNYKMLSIIQSEPDKGNEIFSIVLSGPEGFEIPEGTPIPFLRLEELHKRIKETQGSS